MRPIFAVILSSLLLLPTQAFAAGKSQSALERVSNSGTLRCGYVNWFPYYYKDPNMGAPAGLNFDIMNEVAKQLDVKIEWAEEVGWATIVEGLKGKRYDMHCTSMWPDAPKIKNLHLSRPLFYSTLYPYARADDKRFDGNIESINKGDVRIAAIDGALSYNMAKEVFPKAKIVALANSVQEADFLMTVTTGKADIVVMDKDEIKKFMETNPGKLRQVANVAPVKVFPHVLAFAQGDDDLARAVDFALQLMIDNGTMAQILKKHGSSYLLPPAGYVLPGNK